MLGSIKRFLSRRYNDIRKAFAWIGKQENQEKVAKEIAVALDLSEKAAPSVRQISAALGGDDLVVLSGSALEAANRMGIKIEQILEEPDWHRKVGLALDLAGNSLKEELREMLPTLEHGIELDGKVIKTAEQLDALSANVFHTPAQLAIRALRVAGMIGGIASQAAQQRE
ncbi:MAG TPA: hypothetical protein VF747_13000 [Blastocatellia bacterium]|jgi:hypothetical protein